MILVLNAAALERSLYLLSEVLLLNRPVIAALNMLDVASGQSIQINTLTLQEKLGIPVVPMVAKKNNGIRDLVDQISAFAAEVLKYSPINRKFPRTISRFTGKFWKSFVRWFPNPIRLNGPLLK